MLTKEAASELAKENYNDIYSFCLSRLNNVEDACDVTQDVFLLFQERLQTLDNSNIRSWLLTVANKKIMNEYRNSIRSRNILPLDKRSEKTNEILYELDDYCYITDEAIDAAKEKILSVLSPEERELFFLVYQKRLKYSEAARELCVSENTASLRSYRLRRKILSMIKIAFILLICTIMRLK